jgi:hypothetical protein
MNKIEQIRKMIDYLSKKCNSPIKQYVTGRFQNMEHLIKINDQEVKKREHYAVTVDFNEEKVYWSAWDVSWHNGSSYNEINGSINLEFIIDGYDFIRNEALLFMQQEVIDDEKKKAKQLFDLRAEAKLTQLLCD